MEQANEEQLNQAAPLLNNLGARHGLSSFRHLGDGRLVADVAAGRTYFDIARFEQEASTLLGALVVVVPSGADSVAGRELRPLATASARHA